MPTLKFEPDEVPSVVVSSCSNADISKRDAKTLALLMPGTEESAADGTCLLEDSSWQHLGSELHSAAQFLVTTAAFKAKKGEASPLVPLTVKGTGPRSLLLVGTGPQPLSEPWGPSPYQEAGTVLAAAAKKYSLQSLTIVLNPTSPLAPAAAESATRGLLAVFLSQLLYEPTSTKSKPLPGHKLAAVELLVVRASPADQAWLQEQGPAIASAAVAFAKGVYLNRYLIDLPANICTPSCLAAAAAHISSQAPAELMQLQVLEQEQCEALGMGLFLGVSQGSDEPLKLIHLKYKASSCTGGSKKVVALVGKGLTFDTGGYNLKVHGGVETMKCDMGGAAAVLGAARIITELQPEDLEVHFITASCENMISGRATRPSDIHTSANGKTVEVNDTDAEGRLTLADALWYAQEKAAAEVVVDIATLTGACGIALGQETGGMFSNDEGLASGVKAAGQVAGEKFWQLPLDPSLKKLLESPVADLKNYAGRWGGAITAALFLQEFINPGVAWAHLDIAGPAWSDKHGTSTGFGSSTLATWLLERARVQAG